MSRTRSVAKPFEQLNQKDLLRTPVWAFKVFELEFERSMRSKVVPVEGCERIDNETTKLVNPQGEMLVAADFTFADGTVQLGLVSPGWRSLIKRLPTTVAVARKNNNPWALLGMRPSLLTTKGLIPLYRGNGASPRRTMDRVYKEFGKAATELFPIRFASRLPHAGEFFGEGVLPGFIACVERIHIAG